MFESLKAQGFDVHVARHAGAILGGDLPEAESEIEEALLSLQIPISEIIASGGGESRGTQRLKAALNERGWHKHNFHVEVRIDGAIQDSISHEVDHVKRFDSGTVLLELEWNNKDPFFDRDLANFKSLHGNELASVGVIVTRGASLQVGLETAIQDFLEARDVKSVEDLDNLPGKKTTTDRQRKEIERRIALGQSAAEAISGKLVSDKFGSATTHWSKLMNRVDRGYGSPCPLVLLGIPLAVLTDS